MEPHRWREKAPFAFIDPQPRRIAAGNWHRRALRRWDANHDMSHETRFGDPSLRLDRDLLPGMAVTIEPGFYRVPAVSNDRDLTGSMGANLDRDRLARFADVRGIRIEDDVVVTDRNPREVMSTRALPPSLSAVNRAP